MGLFKKTKPAPLPYSLEEYEPVIRSSICTGERVACMRHRVSGQLRELSLLRTEADLEDFCRACGLRPGDIRTIY